jgi:hypothetical protein
MSKLIQKQQCVNGHIIYVSLIGDVGYISIEDNNLYYDNDSRSERRDLMFNKIMIPCMTRKNLKELKTIIEEVLKNSK